VPAEPEALGPYGKRIVGGPKQNMSGGTPVFTEGRSIKAWPFRTGDEMVGFLLNEYVHTKSKAKLFHNGTDIAYASTHAWQLREGEWRYMGVFKAADDARAKIILAKVRADASQQVQRVASPPSRIRRAV
jgi:hypothetical protein